MKAVGLTLDPTQFTIVRHVAIVDEFVMTNDDGSFVANVDAKFLTKLVDHMNEREATTGDLCPVVIGHTQDGLPEVDQPPVVGYVRNWSLGPFFDTGRQAAFADVWVMNDEVDRARKYPRRSAEIWVTRYEADPLSLLGATTPARDLGLLKLSRGGSITYESPGEMKMPDEPKKDDKDKSVSNPDAAGTKGLEAKLDQILAAIQSLVESDKGVHAQLPGAKDGEPAPGGEGGDEISDEELDKLLGEMGGGGEPPMDDKSRKGEPEPVKNNANCGYGGGNDTHVPDMVKKLQRDVETLATENETNKVKLSLADLQRQGYSQCDPNDAALVQDLVAMPAEIRTRTIDRLKLSRAPGRHSHNLESAINDAAAPPPPNGMKRVTPADQSRLIKLAREKGTSYESVARAEGFHIPE